MKIQWDQAHKVLSTEQLSSPSSMWPPRKIRAEPACWERKEDLGAMGVSFAVKRRDVTSCYATGRTNQAWLVGQNVWPVSGAPRPMTSLTVSGNGHFSAAPGNCWLTPGGAIPSLLGWVKGAEQLPCQGRGTQPWRPSKERSKHTHISARLTSQLD